MLADALWSEAYRLLRNRTTVFLGVFLAPLMFAVGGVAFLMMNKAQGDALAARAGIPSGLGLQPVDLADVFGFSADHGANGVLLVFMLIAAAAVYAGDYRWETWRLISARNARWNLILGKIGVMKLAALAAMAAFLVASLVFFLAQSFIAGRPLTFTASGLDAGSAALTALLSYVRIVQYGLVALLAAVVTRSMMAALFIPIALGFVQSLLGGPGMAFLGWEPSMWLPQLLLPGLAYDTLKAAVEGGMDAPSAAAVFRALTSLALWCLIPTAAAVAWFNRQDLSKE
jgi:ABC-2 type transport system permease protein